MRLAETMYSVIYYTCTREGKDLVKVSGLKCSRVFFCKSAAQ